MTIDAETKARIDRQQAEDAKIRSQNGPGCIWPVCTCGKYQPGCAAKSGANPRAGLMVPPWAAGGVLGVKEEA